jgi:DNA-binding CsgD family transcriptional regulator
LDLERELAGVVEVSDLSGGILLRLQRFLGASGSTLFHFEPSGGVTMRGGTLAEPMSEYPPDLFEEDPAYRWNLQSSPSWFITPGRDIDFAPFSEGRAYADFYRPREIGFMSGIRPTGLRFGTPNMFGLMFCTPKVQRRFDDDRLKELGQLEIAFRSAARRIARFRALEQKQDMLCRLLERRQGSFLLWDSDGRVVWVSASAQRQLEGPLARSEIERAAALALRQLRRTETSARDALLGRPRRLQSARGTPLLVEFSWIASADRRPWLLAELKTDNAAATLAELSASETRVLQLLMQGLSNLEIATQLGVSTETVKTHVKHILAKLGVSSRAKAVRIAHRALHDE